MTIESPVPVRAQAEFVCPANTDHWREQRKTGLGASDSATIAGISRWQSPYELYQRRTGHLPPIAESEAMRLGSQLEPFIAAEFERRTGETVELQPGMYRHPERRWLLATPDGFLRNRTQLLEIKATKTSDGLGDSDTDRIRPEWICQALHQMAVTGVRRTWFAVLIGGLELRIYQVDFRSDLWAKLFDALGEFWRCIESGTPPAVDWLHPNTPEIVSMLGVELSAGSHVLSEDAAESWEEYEAIGRQIRDLSKERNLLKEECLKEMGDFHEGILPGGTHMIRRKLIEKEPYTVTPKPYFDVRKVRVK